MNGRTWLCTLAGFHWLPLASNPGSKSDGMRVLGAPLLVGPAVVTGSRVQDTPKYTGHECRQNDSRSLKSFKETARELALAFAVVFGDNEDQVRV